MSLEWDRHQLPKKKSKRRIFSEFWIAEKKYKKECFNCQKKAFAQGLCKECFDKNEFITANAATKFRYKTQKKQRKKDVRAKPNLLR